MDIKQMIVSDFFAYHPPWWEFLFVLVKALVIVEGEAASTSIGTRCYG